MGEDQGVPAAPENHNSIDSPQGSTVQTGLHFGHTVIVQPAARRARGTRLAIGGAALVVLLLAAGGAFLLGRNGVDTTPTQKAADQSPPTPPPVTTPPPTSSSPPPSASSRSASSRARSSPVTSTPSVSPSPGPAPIREIRPFTPMFNTDGAPCSHNQLCAYWGGAGSGFRFDLAVNLSDRGVCYTVSEADRGFATTYNGSGYRVNLYPARACGGEPQQAPLNVNTVSEFQFFSYAVA